MKTQAANQDADIDFLPAKYREESLLRRIRLWRALVIAVVSGVLLSATLLQLRMRRNLESDLAMTMPLFEAAVARRARLAALEADKARLESEAELITYLRHPWPRSQILTAVLEPLPKAITIREMRLTSTQAGSLSATHPPRPRGRTPAAENVHLMPAQHDLRTLRQERDGQMIVVSLTGTADDLTAINVYLTRVARHPMITRAELRGVETDAGNHEGGTGFRARLFLRAAYGQPGGPETSPRPQTAERRRRDRRAVDDG